MPTITFRCSDEIAAAIRSAAKRCDMTVTDFIVDCCSRIPVKFVPPSELTRPRAERAITRADADTTRASRASTVLWRKRHGRP